MAKVTVTTTGSKPNPFDPRCSICEKETKFFRTVQVDGVLTRIPMCANCYWYKKKKEGILKN